LSRTAALVLLGCLIDSSLAKRPLFDLGVLQLIGLAFGSAALLSGLPVRTRLATAGGLLLFHWAAIRFVPVPALGAGAFTEDGHLILYLNQTSLQWWGLSGLISVIPTTALVLIGTAAGDLLRSERVTAPGRAGALALGGLGLLLVGWLWS